MRKMPHFLLAEPGNDLLFAVRAEELSFGSLVYTIDQDLVAIFIDGCEAAKSLPGFELIPGDINEDCVVDEKDLEILEAHWLESNALEVKP